MMSLYYITNFNCESELQFLLRGAILAAQPKKNRIKSGRALLLTSCRVPALRAR